ncbi:MAG: DcaP family trimeric outer membrane transporter [Kangiellaceae bacterium]
MKRPIKKLTKSIGLSMLTLPVLLMAAPSFSAETIDQRIQKLEALVKELKSSKTEAKEEKNSKEKHSYKFGGFIKATATFSDYSDGDLAANSGLRDFYIPGAIPVGGTGESQDFDFSAKETRIGFKSTHLLASGDKLTTNIEMDFLLPPGGNERVSNSYNPRLRHAYLTYNNWLFGQTWSTFQDVGALPESVDFLGAPDGIVFNRQPMVRYTNGAWQFAIENPETTITPFAGGARIVADDNGVPDFVARYNHKADWGHLTVSGLFRQLAYNNGSDDESTSSTGVSVTGKIKVGSKNDFRFNLATGSGMGRYVGLNTANGAVIDAAGNLDAIDSSLAAISFRHHWNSQWRSNFIVSGMNIDNNTALTGTGVTKTVNSFQVNLLHSPVPKLTLGFGFLSAERELESGASGDMFRTIFTAKYGF